MIDEFGVVTATMDTSIRSLSGGNQQKAVLARGFRDAAKVVLIDEPTQGVDAGSRHEIYRTIRSRLTDGRAVIVNGSDAVELAGICDRVLVFSRGQNVKELRGDDVSEPNIVQTFLTAKGAEQDGTIAADSRLMRVFEVMAAGSAVWWVPLVILSVIFVTVGFLANLQSDVFLGSRNIRHILSATAPAAIADFAQFHVLIVRGLDVSVGSTMSLTVVVASYLIAFDASLPTIIFGLGACLGTGLVVGLINGCLVQFARINTVISTIAMLSILQGFALLGREIPGGLIRQSLTGLPFCIRARSSGAALTQGETT